MVENLKLQNKTISSSDSNLPSGKTVTVPASSTANWCTDTTQACFERLLTLDATDTSIPDQSSAQSNYGVYYNWYTATATYGSYEKTSGNVDYSICPKMWHLPTDGNSSSTDFQILYSYYDSRLDITSSNGPSIVLSGYRIGSSTRNQGSHSMYWSRTAPNVNYAYGLHLDASNAYAVSSITRTYGASIRCLAN